MVAGLRAPNNRGVVEDGGLFCDGGKGGSLLLLRKAGCPLAFCALQVVWYVPRLRHANVNEARKRVFVQAPRHRFSFPHRDDCSTNVDRRVRALPPNHYHNSYAPCCSNRLLVHGVNTEAQTSFGSHCKTPFPAANVRDTQDRKELERTTEKYSGA